MDIKVLDFTLDKESGIYPACEGRAKVLVNGIEINVFLPLGSGYTNPLLLLDKGVKRIGDTLQCDIILCDDFITRSGNERKMLMEITCPPGVNNHVLNGEVIETYEHQIEEGFVHGMIVDCGIPVNVHIRENIECEDFGEGDFILAIGRIDLQRVFQPI